MNQPRRAPRRKLDGVLLLDKPAGLSSNACLGIVKRLFMAEKAGHTGTLDPFATGLLPVALGEATKFSQGLFNADKTYLATMRLGLTTTTGDIEGEVTAERPVHCGDPAIRAAMAGFCGDILQVPPMYSALKRDGKPLYAYARAGIELERAPRPVTIHAIDLVVREDASVVFRVTCSKGTYIRTLAEDIGGMLGCGAHLTALRRERVGRLDVANAHTLESLEALDAAGRDACLAAPDSLVTDFPRIVLDAIQAARLRLGQRVPVDAVDGEARAYDDALRFLGMVRVAAGVAHPLRLTSAA